MENKSKSLEFLNIPHSSFYYKSVKEEKDLSLKQSIEAVLASNPSYGHRRIAIELRINKKKIKRVMRKFGLKPLRSHRKPRKSKQNEQSEPSPNLLISIFPLYPNHVWASDFTYLKWKNRWVYVCTVIDLFSREVIGLSIKTSHSAMLVSETLLNAISASSTPLIVHSDQGSEYKSKLFRSILTDFNVTQSMSKKGSPWQNGYQESFFGNWKVDIGDVNRFLSLGELTAEIYKSIYYYNNLRIHTALGCAPKQFARQHEIKYHTNQEKLTV